MLHGIAVNQIIEGLICVIAGICVIIFRDKLARYIIEFQNKSFKFHYGKTEIDGAKFICILGGDFVIVLGCLAMLGIIDWHQK